MIKLPRREAKYSYKKGARYHVTPIGELPGVTTVLNATSDYDFKQWREDNPEESKRCLDRGLKLHDDVESYFLNNTKAKQSELFDKLLNTVLKHIQPIVWEHQVYSELGFSGSLDCLAYHGDRLILFDWKSAKKTKSPSQVKNYLLQVAAYSYALKELDCVNVNQASVVIIPENGDCQLFNLKAPSIIDAYFDEFLKRLQWFQNINKES
jgi:hypothetical protein